MKRAKKIGGIGGLVLALMASWGFGVVSGQVKIRVGDFFVATTGETWEVMRKKELPRKYGLDVEFRRFVDPEAYQTAFAAGQLDVIITAVSSMGRLRARGVDIRLVYPASWSFYSLVVPKESAIKGPTDLKGKRLGVFSASDTSIPIIYEALRRKGIDLFKEVKLITAPPVVLPKLLERGEVDAISLWEPFVTQLLVTRKYQALTDLNDWYEELAGSKWLMIGLGMLGRFIDDHPKEAKRFLDMWLEASNYLKDHPEEIKKWAEGRGIKDPEVQEMLARRVTAVFLPDYTEKLIADQQRYFEFAIKTGFFKAIPEGLFVRLGEVRVK